MVKYNFMFFWLYLIINLRLDKLLLYLHYITLINVIFLIIVLSIHNSKFQITIFYSIFFIFLFVIIYWGYFQYGFKFYYFLLNFFKFFFFKNNWFLINFIYIN